MHFFPSAVVKDLRRHRRDFWKPLLWGAIPLIVGGLLTLAMGGGDGTKPLVHLLIADEDDSTLSGFVKGAFSQGDMAELFRTEAVSEEIGRQQLEQGAASALLIIPAGFQQAVLEDQPCQLTLVTNPAQRILPGIAEGTIRVVVDGVFYAHRLFGDEVKQIASELADGGDGPTALQIVAVATRVGAIVEQISEHLDPLRIKLETEIDVAQQDAEEAKTGVENDVAVTFYILPGILLMALVFMGEGLSGDIWIERKQGTLRRVITTPGTLFEFLSGKLVAGMLVIGCVSLLLLVIGIAYFELPWHNLPLALAWMILSGAVLTVAMQLLQLWVSSQRAGSVITNSIMFPLLMIGGSFFPFEAMPKWMATIGAWTPNGWMLTQLKAILLSQAALSSLLPAALALVVILVLLFGIVVRRTWHIRARS